MRALNSRWHLEPYRGYHRFMRALPAIQAARPKAVTIIVGGDGSSYSPRPPAGTSWKRMFFEEVRADLDLSRVVFLPPLPPGPYLQVLQLSACHVYLTYPFVLSWSCVEAMAAGCLLVGSRTAPLQEVLQHGHNGLLCDFFDTPALARQVSEALAHPEAYRALRVQARRDVVARYDLAGCCLPAQLELVQGLVVQ